MPKLGTGMVQLGSQITATQDAYIRARAKRLGWTRGKTITQIMNFWFAFECPPLSELDAATPLPAFSPGPYDPDEYEFPTLRATRSEEARRILRRGPKSAPSPAARK